MKRISSKLIQSAVILVIVAAGTGASANAATITSIDFKGQGETSQIEIRSDGPLTFDKQVNEQDNQLVLELKGAKLSKSSARKLDTSSFEGPISLVSPYQVDGQPDTARVVVQMRQLAAADVTQDGNLIKISVPNNAGGGATGNTAAGADPAPKPDVDAAQSATPPPPPAAEAVAQGSTSATPAAPAATAPKTNLDEFAQNEETKSFTGKTITLQVRDADLGDVFRLVGEASGFNILVGDDVKGKITLSLVDVPWDQALDVILHTQGLGAERNNNILRITSLRRLTQEKQDELAAKNASDANAPRVTRVFPISYANLGDLTKILIQFGGGSMSGMGSIQSSIGGSVQPASTQSSASSAGGPLTVSGSSSAGAMSGSSGTGIIQSDPRTNTIIVSDLPDKVEKMKKLIEILDTQTPQVLIEAKVIEASETFSRNIGGKLGAGSPTTPAGGVPQFATSFNAANPLDSLVSSNGGVFASGAAMVSPMLPGQSQLAFAPNLSFLPGVQVNAFLSLAENESEVKQLASPKMVVLNKEVATVVQSTPVLAPQTTVIAGVGTAQGYTILQANLSLSVQPTVTNEGSILMQLALERDIAVNLNSGNSAVANRTLTTKVLVASGTTLVIGGVYTADDNVASDGFPFLRKLPIIGALFGDETVEHKKSELFFFITPKILNAKEAGIST